MATRRDRKPLLAYLRVEEDFEAKLLTTLERTAQQTKREIRALSGKRGIGAKVRQDQLRLVLKATLERQAELWRIVGSQVQAGRADAMAAAVKTNFVYEDVLLKSVASAAERRLLLESAQAQATKGIDAVIQKLNGLSDYELSTQVYKSAALSNGLVRRKVIDALSRGASWKEMADDVSGLIDPRTPGGVSYAAKRLGRTEINNAYHAAAVVEGQQSPFIIGQKWNLSGSHPKPDECNQFADRVHYDGGDPGVYRPADAPGKPHPQCLCYLTPVTPSREEFLNNFLGGKYDTYIDKHTTPPAPVAAPRKTPLSRLDAKKWQRDQEASMVDKLMGGKDVSPFGQTRAQMLKAFASPAPEAVYKLGRVTTQVRTKNFDVQKADKVTRTLHRLASQDDLDRDIQLIVRELTPEEGAGSTLAYTSVGSDSMVFDPRVFNGIRSRDGWMEVGRDADTDPIDYVLTHEYGHMRAGEKHGTDIDPRGLSRYAKSDGDEAYAEAYAEWILTKGKTGNKTVQKLAERFSWPTVK